jgi:UTP--glucose-1-phosphate uridylyltransferase
MKVRKAVIPAAGFGTRFLPQTKAMPKEMLPVVDKPTIQYLVEELVDAGIEDILFVTGYHKRAIEDHFDLPNKELIENLKQGGEKKRHFIDEIEGIGGMANFMYLRQKGRYGNATPIMNSKHLVENEPFIYKWADDLFHTEPSAIKQLLAAFDKYQGTCLACIRAQRDEDYNQWAFAQGKYIDDGVIDIEDIVEKPGKENAGSDLGAMYAMVLTPEIFPYLQQAYDEIEEGIEVNYADGVRRMVKDGKKAYAIEIKGGKYYDTGNKLDYLKTVVEYALRHDEVGEKFREYLKTLSL